MKKIINLFVCLSVLFLIACAGSDTYQGAWKAMDAQGNKFDITFEAKKFSVKDSSGQTKTYEYKQNSVNINNSIKTYGIHLSDGRVYQIHFPKGDDDSVALIHDENGQPLFILSRKGYMSYDDIYKL